MHEGRNKNVPVLGESGLAMIVVVATIMILMTISVALVGLMNTDLLHAFVQDAVARSFYLAQAGLEEAKGQVAATSEPQAYATSEDGIHASFGNGQFTYWVDAGPASECGAGLKTLEALGEVRVLGRTFPSRVRACAVAGAPVPTALFGAGRVEIRGAETRVYLAPYGTGSPGGGGSLGSFTEIRFADPGAHLNALSEETMATVTLRDLGTVPDYTLFGFSSPPAYDPDPAIEPTPWVLSVFGDLIEARPKDGESVNVCGTGFACLTAANRDTDIGNIAALRSTVGSASRDAAARSHVYMNSVRQQVLPALSLDASSFEDVAAHNGANRTVNKGAGLGEKTDSVYTPFQFNQVLAFLANHSGQILEGLVYVTGTVQLTQDVNLGGDAGDVTLAVEGDLLLGEGIRLINRHDLTTPAGRGIPGILVFGKPAVEARPTTVCGGQLITGSGRLVLCGGTTQQLIVDGLLYTADGMAIGRGASIDQIGAMYHNSRGAGNPSFTADDAVVVVRFDPLALTVFRRGLLMLSWQQLQ
jgi:hypothetical protein